MKQIIYSKQSRRVLGVSFDGFHINSLPDDQEAILVEDNIEVEPSTSAVSAEGELITVPELSNATVPTKVSMRQARIALHRAGLLQGVINAIASMQEPNKTEATIAWEYSQEVQRYNGLVAELGPLLGLTEQQIDDLFVTASSL